MDQKVWKNRFKRIAACVLSFSMTIGTVGLTLGALSAMQGCSDDSQSEQNQDTYTFTYDSNYAGAKNKVVTITAGKKADNLTVYRYGYVFDGWFCEKECKTPYDFTRSVNKNTTIYALWTDESTIVYYDVTFDYGEGIVTTEQIREDRVVPTYSAMSSQKFGYEIVGWYLDEVYTQKFELGVTPVTKNLTLYAKYVQLSDVKYTEDGDFDFNNVEISLAFKDYHQTSTKKWVQTLIKEFNEAYEGKISISIVSEKDKPTLWFDSTSKLNALKSDIYSMEDALAIAGKDFNDDEYYQNWINDCYIDGELYSMPIASFVPAIGYNRSLMDKYNGGVEPTDHASLMELLEKVHAGESVKDDWVCTISMSNSDDMKEIASNSFYLQNDMPLYSLTTDGKFANEWLKSDLSKQNAVSSVNWFRNMFVNYNYEYKYLDQNNTLAGKQYKPMGKIWGTTWLSGKNGVDWTYVGEAKSFMGVMGNPNLNQHFGWRTNQTEKTLWTKTTGIMPISYLFGDGENAERIFVQNYSLAIPKYGNSNTQKVVAAAVFAEFASKYCEDATESYLYPTNKLAQYNAFNKLTRPWCVDYILKECGERENFYTYPGTTYEYKVTVTEQVSFLTNKLFWVDDEADDKVVLATIEALCNSINKEIGV